MNQFQDTKLLDENESDPVSLWAEIHRLRAALKGPDGFDSWQDAALDERLRRINAEKALTEFRRLIQSQVDHAYLSAENSTMEARFGERKGPVGIRVAAIEACLGNPNAVGNYTPLPEEPTLGIGRYLIYYVQRKSTPFRAYPWYGTESEMEGIERLTGWQGTIKEHDPEVQDQFGEHYIHFKKMGDMCYGDWIVEITVGQFIIVSKHVFVENYDYYEPTHGCKETQLDPDVLNDYRTIVEKQSVKAIQWNGSVDRGMKIRNKVIPRAIVTFLSNGNLELSTSLPDDEWPMTIKPNDWVIVHDRGISAVENKIFNLLYEPSC